MGKEEDAYISSSTFILYACIHLSKHWDKQIHGWGLLEWRKVVSGLSFAFCFGFSFSKEVNLSCESPCESYRESIVPAKES